MFVPRSLTTARRPRRVAAAGLLLVILLLTSCTSSETEGATANPTAAPEPTAVPEPSATAEPEPTATVVPESTATVAPTEVPATVEPSATPEPTAEPLEVTDPVIANSEALQQLVTILDWVNTDPPDQPTYESFFAPSFVESVPWDQWLLLDLQLGAAAPWTIIEANDDGLLSEARMVDSNDMAAIATIGLDEDGLVENLVFLPAIDIDEPTSMEETITALEAFGEVRWMVADPADCSTSLAGDGEDDLVPLGSVFKLYVLGAVVDAVEAGTVTWDQPIEVQDELDSLPAGTTQTVPDGTEISVRDMAELMITISDNTATDHLIDLVGRTVIEESLDDWGHSDPDATIPFMTTREVFILKLTADEQLAAWADASVDARRQILAELAEFPLPSQTDPALFQWTSPISIDEAEWFATPQDLCRVMTQLRSDPEAASVLAEPSLSNSGDDIYSWEGSKGGSEPGVLTLVTMFELADSDVQRVAVMSLANDTVAFGPEANLNAEFVRVFAADVSG